MNKKQRVVTHTSRISTVVAKVVAIAVTVVGLTACGGEGAADIAPQQWQNMIIHVESRPSPPRAGMNEFLVIATDKSGRPGYDLMILMRSDSHDQWVQAIEDGQEGVYRRAVKVEPKAGEVPVLQVKILQKGTTEAILHFPLPMGETKG